MYHEGEKVIVMGGNFKGNYGVVKDVEPHILGRIYHVELDLGEQKSTHIIKQENLQRLPIGAQKDDSWTRKEIGHLTIAGGTMTFYAHREAGKNHISHLTIGHCTEQYPDLRRALEAAMLSLGV